MSIRTLIPDAETLLALPPEELAFYVLQVIQQSSAARNFHIQSIQNDVAGTAGRSPAYPQQYLREIETAISEAWQWLENQLLIVKEAGINGENGFRVLGRRAKGLRTAEQFRAFRQALAFPKELLHPAIAERAWIAVMRNEFDAAVLFSFKAVEVAVREAGGFADTEQQLVPPFCMPRPSGQREILHMRAYSCWPIQLGSCSRLSLSPRASFWLSVLS
jgi:hypothetical protein